MMYFGWLKWLCCHMAIISDNRTEHFHTINNSVNTSCIYRSICRLREMSQTFELKGSFLTLEIALWQIILSTRLEFFNLSATFHGLPLQESPPSWMAIGCGWNQVSGPCVGMFFFFFCKSQMIFCVEKTEQIKVLWKRFFSNLFPTVWWTMLK